MTSSKRRGTKLANIFGTFGYLSVVVQWFWFVAVIILPYLQESSLKTIFLPQQGAIPSTVTTNLDFPPFIQIIIAGAAIIFTLAITLYAIYMVPRSIGKAGKKLTQTSAHVVTTRIKHHHKPLSAPRRKRIYEYLTWSVKTLLLIVPCLLLLLPAQYTLPIPHEAILIIGVFCAGMSLLWFGLQYIISRISRSDAREIW